MSFNTLLVDTSPCSDLLVNDEGEPVWPVRTESEFDAISRSVQLFGGNMSVVKGRAVNSPITIRKLIDTTTGIPIERPKSESQTESVVGLGSNVEDEARLYAHLTSRSIATVGSVKELKNAKLPEVLVTTFPKLTAEVIEYLHSNHDARQMPGIICAENPKSLRNVILTRSIARCISVVTNAPPYANISVGSSFCDEQWPTTENGNFYQRLQNLLGAGASLLTIYTHSDGLCINLGSNLTLCPIHTPPQTREVDGAPRCWITRNCHRHLIMIDEDVPSAQRVSIDAVRARILVLSTCIGVMPAGGVIDTAWGFGSRLIEAGVVGAVVTTSRIEIANPALLAKLVGELNCGKTIGEAVKASNRSAECISFDSRLCLFGDPNLCIPSGCLVVPPRNESSDRNARIAPRLPRKRDVAQAGFLRMLLMEAVNHLSGDVVTEQDKSRLLQAATEALKATMVYERMAALGKTLDSFSDSPGTQMRRSVLRFLGPFGCGLMRKYSSKLVERSKRGTSFRRCFVCGRAVNTRVYRFRIPFIDSRRRAVCDQCGVIEDSPVGSKVSFSLEPHGAIKLHGEVPHANCSVGIALGSQLSTESTYQEWHFTPDIVLPPEFSLPVDWPPGPILLSVIILWNASVLTLHQPARMLETGTYWTPSKEGEAGERGGEGDLETIA